MEERNPATSTEGGFSLIEVSVAMVVMAFASLAVMSLTTTSVSLEAANRETAAANSLARKVLEDIQELSFSELFASYNDDPLDDPLGADTALGSSFTVESDATLTRNSTVEESLTSQLAPPMTVKITFPVLSDGTLSEMAGDMLWGQNWDLNADGTVTSSDVSTDYKLMPVKIRISWDGLAGSRSIELCRMIMQKPWAIVKTAVTSPK